MEIRGIEVTVNTHKRDGKTLYAATATDGKNVAHSFLNVVQDDAIEHAVWQIEQGFAKPVQSKKTASSKPTGAAVLVIGDDTLWPEYHDWRK